MALSLFDSLTPMTRFDEDFGRMMRQAFSTPSADFVPAVNVVRENDKTVITVDVPGLDPAKDLDVEVANGQLTVSGTKRDVHESHEDDRYVAREIRSGSFTRVFGLPDGVTSKDVKADYTNGQLTLTVSEPATQAAAKIAVGSGEQHAEVKAGNGESEPKAQTK